MSDAISKATEAIEILRGNYFGFDALQLIDTMVRQNIGQRELPELYEGDHYSCAQEVFEMSWSDYASELGTGELSEEYR